MRTISTLKTDFGFWFALKIPDLRSCLHPDSGVHGEVG